ncbi:MAG TPA: TonB-dependent receptor, partial [Dysgonomonas sp.]|nr:TonB-dependent receptor [Dysgonomonas sp.]
MKAFHLIIIYFLSIGLLSAHNTSTGKNSLSGTVTDKINGETLIGVNVYFPELKKGAITDDEGRYRITNLPSIKTTIQVTYIGHQPIVLTVNLSETSVLDFVLDESSARINEVIVTALTGNSLMQRTPTPISLVSKSKLLQNSSSNIIDALTIEPGISQITTGNAISKPVIRGLGYIRVVVVNDGVRQEGQQWGDEHGIEIDGQSVNSVEILKGPATLMYGSDAMAGVIHFLPSPILPDGKRELGLYSEYQTNNGLFNNSLHLSGNENGFVWNWRYSDKRAHSYKNKYDGYIFNSGFQEKALTGLLGLNKGWGYSHLTLNYFHQTPGIVTGNRDTETGKLIRPTVVDGKYTHVIASDKDGKSYGHFVPYQEIYHYKAVLNNNFIIGNGNLKSIIGYQQNRRQEFEDVFDKKNYALYFQLHTLNYDIRYLFPEYNGYKIITGLNGMYQSSFNKSHETLLPEYNIFDMGLFAVLSKNFGKLDISGGIRYDIRHKNVKEFHPHIHHHHGEEEENGHDEEHEHEGHDHEHEDQIFPAFSKNFAGISGSLGIAYQITNDCYTKLNFARGFRAPNISELSAQGSHGGTIRFEIGNRDLKAENSWQIDWGLGYSSPTVSGEITLFFNRINNYIFSHKLVDDHGHD